jgi:hyperosmotically inducible protein
VPAKYRNMDGELPLRLRTDAGGYSDDVYVKVLKPKTVSPKVIAGGARTLPPGAATMNAGAAGVAHVSPDVALANRVRAAMAAKLGAEAAKTIEVSSKDGVVTLSGSVATAALRDAAESAATNVAGVKRVVDNVAAK